MDELEAGLADAADVDEDRPGSPGSGSSVEGRDGGAHGFGLETQSRLERFITDSAPGSATREVSGAGEKDRRSRVNGESCETDVRSLNDVERLEVVPSDLVYPKLSPELQSDLSGGLEHYSYAASRSADPFVRIVACELLATTYTRPLMRPRRTRGVQQISVTYDGFKDSKLISSLRLHTEQTGYPASGYEPRNSSPDFPLRNSAASKENPLAEATSKRRAQRRGKKTRRSKKSQSNDDGLSEQQLSEIAEVLNSQGDTFPEESNPSTTPPDVDEDATDSSSPLPDRPYGRPRFFSHHPSNPSRYDSSSSSSSRSRTTPNIPTLRGLHHLQRAPSYSVQPVIRAEPHPVFIQPVKEFVLRRWRRRGFRTTTTANGQASVYERSSLAARRRQRERRARARETPNMSPAMRSLLAMPDMVEGDVGRGHRRGFIGRRAAAYTEGLQARAVGTAERRPRKVFRSASVPWRFKPSMAGASADQMEVEGKGRLEDGDGRVRDERVWERRSTSGTVVVRRVGGGEQPGEEERVRESGLL